MEEERKNHKAKRAEWHKLPNKTEKEKKKRKNWFGKEIEDDEKKIKNEFITASKMLTEKVKKKPKKLKKLKNKKLKKQEKVEVILPKEKIIIPKNSSTTSYIETLEKEIQKTIKEAFNEPNKTKRDILKRKLTELENELHEALGIDEDSQMSERDGEIYHDEQDY